MTKQKVTFLKNLDTGMRRLGFLEILLSDCIKTSNSDYQSIGELLWEKAKDRQKEWLRLLGENRGLKADKEEVGCITDRIADRYAKLATELGFVTSGFPKVLTDSGVLFKKMRSIPFFLTEGQKIVYLKQLLRFDRLITSYLIKKIVKNQELTKNDAMHWFVKECIPKLLSNHRHELDDAEVIRLRSAAESFASGKRDNVKHIVDTRLEQLADLGIIKKLNASCRSTETAEFFAKHSEKIACGEMTDDDYYKMVAEVYGADITPTDGEIFNAIVEEFNGIATPPMFLASLEVLQGIVCLKFITEKKMCVIPSKVRELENRLVRDFHGKVQLFEGRTDEKAYITIPHEVRRQVLGGRLKAS